MSSPLIAIFVRHSEECKHADDELYRRCNCRKHLRWTHNGVQYRKTAGTRSWVDAEQASREFALSIESLEVFVLKEPLRRTHECAFGVLALESEFVDPRL